MDWGKLKHKYLKLRENRCLLLQITWCDALHMHWTALLLTWKVNIYQAAGGGQPQVCKHGAGCDYTQLYSTRSLSPGRLVTTAAGPGSWQLRSL